MKQYNKNVRVVMDFLAAEEFSASVIHAYRICYRMFREFLMKQGIEQHWSEFERLMAEKARAVPH